MTYEVEQKFRVADVAAIQEKLAALGVLLGPEVEQVDRYFNHPARDFAETDEALRLRQVGEENRLTYKGPKLDAATKTRREIELSYAGGVAAAEQFSEMLTLLGFRRSLTVTKIRRIAHCEFAGQKFEVALDSIEQLGDFVELEISAEEATLAAAKTALAKFAAELNLTKPERRSYLELLLAQPTSP